MPGLQVGVYPGELAAGTQVSSTYEGRHLTVLESEIIHPFRASTFVNKGDPVLLCRTAVPATYGVAVGVAFATATVATDLIAIDTEGIFNLTVFAQNDAGAVNIEIGDELFIHDGSTGAATLNGLGDAEISRISTRVTQVHLGYALGRMVAGSSGQIAVKVHFDPSVPDELFGPITFDGAVTMDSTLNVAGLTTLAALTATGVIQLQNTTIITGALFLGAGVNVTGATILNSGLSVAGQVDLQTVFIHSQMFMAGILHLPDNVDAVLLPAANPGGVNRLWVNAGVVTRN